MIRSIYIDQYRKLQNLNITMSESLNAISGTNGTCKTSLLHIISNSFQIVASTSEWVKDANCLKIIKSVNDSLNPKIETLTRGDKKYNDPAHGKQGTLYTVNYIGKSPLSFRRHNSSINSRYAIKPYYTKGTQDKLPAAPVIYLGLSRLVPFGEFKNDQTLEKIKKGLPDKYKKELAKHYEDFTSYQITETALFKMGDVKTRAEFESDSEGIDSNTISAGEDNLYIILLAIVSLHYYFDSIQSDNDVKSVLLVDELDATLHPAFQIKLLNLLREYAKSYKIQMFFTTHSMTMLEDMLKNKNNVIYLIDNVNNVALMDDPDIFKIKMHLSLITKQDLYYDKIIPVFSEDDEARFLIDRLLDHYENTCAEFRGIKRYFHFVNINLGANNLISLFKDLKMLRNTMKAICILDGDHTTDKTNNIIALPGKNIGQRSNLLSPENLLFQYAEILFNEDDHFWLDDAVINLGYGKKVYRERIAKEIQKYHDNQEGSKVKEREFNKKLFNDNQPFFDVLFKRWLIDERNDKEINRFYFELRDLFKKNAIVNGINPKDWKDKSTIKGKR